MKPNGSVITARDRRNRSIFDYCFSFGIPVLAMATQIVYQPIRFGLAKTTGCISPGSATWPAYLLASVWHPVLACIAALYSCEWTTECLPAVAFVSFPLIFFAPSLRNLPIVATSTHFQQNASKGRFCLDHFALSPPSLAVSDVRVLHNASYNISVCEVNQGYTLATL